MSKHKVLVSWSTGKDCAFALHHIRQLEEYEVVGLLTTITEESNRVTLHSIRYELLKKQAEQLNLPLYPIFIPNVCSTETYATRMQTLLDQAVKQGITHIVFGDLFLEDIRKYRELKMAPTNIIPLFPLWGSDTVSLAKEMINAGCKAVITCIDPKKLDASFVGRQFDEQFLNDLPDGVDPCGEYGEFHTFVYDSPMFKAPIPISIEGKNEHQGCIFVDIMYTEINNIRRA